MLLYEQLKQHLVSLLIKTDEGEINLVMHMSNSTIFFKLWEYIFRICQILTQ
jgi:hypothetical protein